MFSYDLRVPEYVEIVDTSGAAFKWLVDLVYEGEILLSSCQDWGLLFEVLRLSDKYILEVGQGFQFYF